MSRWKEGGFPDVTMKSPLDPALALVRALNERAEAAGLDEHDEPEAMEEFSTPGWLGGYDSWLRGVAGHYLDHRREDWQDGDAICWTWDRLAEELEDDEDFEDGLVAPGDALRPELPAAWAHQRRKMVDLLRYVPVPYTVRVGSGDTHNGVPRSPADSWAAAWRGLGEESGGGGFYAYAQDIYGPDHGWDEGTYCVNLYARIPQRVADSVPEGLRKSAVLRFYADAPASGATNVFSGLGLGVRQGWNEAVPDEDGYFYRTGADWSPARPSDAPWPTPDHFVGVGFRCTRIGCFADARDFFEFYH